MKVDEAKVKIPGLTRTYTFTHISDAHVAHAEETDTEEVRAFAAKQAGRWCIPEISSQEAFEDALRYTEEIGAEALMVTGDCIDYLMNSNLTYVKRKLKELKTQVLYAFGNHECGHYELLPDMEYKERAYEFYDELMFGSPAYWVKDYGEFLVVGLDNSTHKISEEQMQFLKEQISENRPILLMMHIPLYTEEIVAPIVEKWSEEEIVYFTLGNNQDPQEVKEFCELVKAPDNNIAAIFSGHIHLAWQGEVREGLMQYTAAPTFETYIRKITVEPV